MRHDGKIWVGTGKNGPVCLLPSMSNRHGLIAGATGTGKTVTLKVLAEGFSDLGVPVFLSDIKSDLSGMVDRGIPSDAVKRRLQECGVPEESFDYHPYPVRFWDVYGEEGVPVYSTVRDMGPLLLSRMLQLNETQTGVMNILFRLSADRNIPLDTIYDLRRLLAYTGERARDFTVDYGNISVASIGAIQRAVGLLEDQGGDRFFQAPSMDIRQWFRVEEQSGRGLINILSADRLFNNPVMYSTYLLWMLTKLYDLLPERGDAEKPLIVFFFDEAHLLFNDCSRTLMDKIEQVVRLIRSKGVGVFFITQSPADIPMTILGQLGNRVQHALRAYTPLDQKAVRVAAETFRANPSFDTSEAITTLKTGEALISFLDEHGAPGIVQRATILPPQSRLGPITAAERALCLRQGYLIDPESPSGPEAAPGPDLPEAPPDAAAEQPPEPERPVIPEQPAEPGSPANVTGDIPVMAPVSPPEEPEGERPEQAGVPVLTVEEPSPPQEAPKEAGPFDSFAEGPIAPELEALETMCSELSASLDGTEPPTVTYIPPEEPAVSPSTPQRTRVSAAKKIMSQTFKVFDPATGEYVTQEMPQMTQPPVVQQPVVQQPVVQQPVAQQPVYVQQPVVQQPVVQQPVVQQPVVQQPVVQQPAAQEVPAVPTIQVQPAVQQMPVMVLDPTTGQYVQQMMTMQQDPATGNWVPIQQPAIPTDPITLAEQQKLAEQARKEAERAAKEAAKAAKEQEAAERRARNDALREEAAERARRNDSVAGRIKNAAISSATRQVTNSLTKGITNAISDLFSGGKKK